MTTPLLKVENLRIALAGDGVTYNAVENVSFEIGRGEAIYMGGKDIVATEDDYLLIIGCAYGEYEFDTAEEAQATAQEGSWTVRIGHAPNRSPGAAEGQSLIGHEPVHESELEGYHLWKEAFDAGEAGVF